VFLAIFQFLPTIKEAQRYVSHENLKGAKVTCETILSDRAWYGKINHWFFAWIIFVPSFIFSFLPKSPSWLRVLRTIISIAVCYGFMLLMVEHQWDIRNAPFWWHNDPLNAGSDFRIECENIADGFSLIMVLVMGWLPACLYTEICLYIWKQYHLRLSKQIKLEYKPDIVSRTLSIFMRIYIILLGITIIGLLAHIKMFEILYYLIVRPLFIPVEIFFY